MLKKVNESFFQRFDRLGRIENKAGFIHKNGIIIVPVNPADFRGN
jgi:hypothetical protein